MKSSKEGIRSRRKKKATLLAVKRGPKKIGSFPSAFVHPKGLLNKEINPKGSAMTKASPTFNDRKNKSALKGRLHMAKRQGSKLLSWQSEDDRSSIGLRNSNADLIEVLKRRKKSILQRSAILGKPNKQETVRTSAKLKVTWKLRGGSLQREKSDSGVRPRNRIKKFNTVNKARKMNKTRTNHAQMRKPSQKKLDRKNEKSGTYKAQKRAKDSQGLRKNFKTLPAKRDRDKQKKKKSEWKEIALKSDIIGRSDIKAPVKKKSYNDIYKRSRSTNSFKEDVAIIYKKSKDGQETTGKGPRRRVKTEIGVSGQYPFDNIYQQKFANSKRILFISDIYFWVSDYIFLD